MAGKALSFVDAERDANGRLLVESPPRSLVDLLPPPAPAAAPPAPASPRALPPRRVQVAVSVTALLVLAAVWALLPRPAAQAPVRPTIPATAAPAVAASAPSAAPTVLSGGCTITRAAATFYAPGGDPTGDALEAGTDCTLVAWHAGFPDWRQITAGGAPIWVRASVVSATDTTDVPDLAPPPTPTPAPATARPIVIVEQAPPAPTQCATVRGGGATVQRCGSAPLDQLQADAEQAWRAQMQPTTPGGE